MLKVFLLIFSWRASILIGAFLCSLSSLQAEEWTLLPAKSYPVIQTETSSEKITRSQEASLRFLSYNIRNFLYQDLAPKNYHAQKAKPLKSRQAVIEIILASKAEVLGLSEIGTFADLKKLQKELQAQGQEYPHLHWIESLDPIRHLALLSQHPILSVDSQTDLQYSLGDRQHRHRRGILDVTIAWGEHPIRLVGVHFKSKRPNPKGTQHLMRQEEARLLRSHLDEIITDSPETPLIVYGDFNDTKGSRVLKWVKKHSEPSLKLRLFHPADSNQERWTQYWSQEDIYSRFDYLLVSQSLSKHPRWTIQAEILDPPQWLRASDHRAILMTLEQKQN